MLNDSRPLGDDGSSPAHGDVVDCGLRTGRWVLAAAILGSGITFIDGTVVNVALPVLQSELDATVAGAQWIVESYALMLAALILVGGSLGDRLGRRKVFSLGVFIFGLASIWCGLAPNLTNLIFARAVQGLGAALLVPGSLALISANFARSRRGRAIGTWSGVTAISAGVGPVLGGWLVANLSWRWIFFINIPLAAAAILICWFRVPESRDEDVKGRIDWFGAASATIALGGIVFGLIESNAGGFYSARVLWSFVIGIVAGVAFVFAELRNENPMMPFGLFRSKIFAGANLLTLFLYAALGGILFFLPFNLIQVQGYAPAAAGAALLPFVVTMFTLSRWAGGLVDRYGSKLPLVVGPTLAACGFAMFIIPGVEVGSYWTSFFPAIAVMSIGMSIAVAPLTTTVMSAVDERHAGVASGINNAVSRTASLVAVAVFGVVMLGTFGNSLNDQLTAESISADVRSEILIQTGDLVNLKIPESVSDEQKDIIKTYVRNSFVAGFRNVALLAAMLGVLSAIAALALIDGKPAGTVAN
ncbi:MAG: MFS transporter [Acidobacteriota bacterium]